MGITNYERMRNAECGMGITNYEGVKSGYPNASRPDSCRHGRALYRPHALAGPPHPTGLWVVPA